MRPETNDAARQRIARDTARTCERAGVPLETALRMLKSRRRQMEQKR